MTQPAGERASDRAERARQLEEAVHSIRMEGLDITEEIAADAAAYVDGRLTLEDLGRRTRTRYGLEESS